ncbi:hypothetical protein B0H17DRAFT_1235120 [Mycena rosella]|uniref:Endonuclease/exonuclease/phosphatase domain-containing protein n=1 Tax=Mycena rosella TaxID=1033263 RepID=A0AAD7GCS7_MYCRO|nr:hypothetical protein B0H17DRAFT_1235120 [Mycena rosella]
MKRVVDDKRIGVFALQETQMNDIAASQFNNLYGKWFKLFNSGHPIKPDSTAGGRNNEHPEYLRPEYTSGKREDVGQIMNSHSQPKQWVTGNFVEDIEDRTSNKEELVPLSFLCLKALFLMQDGWRTTFPDANEYTCFQKRTNAIKNETHVSGSRLDRIHVPVHRFTRYRNWSIEPSLIASDHHLISVQLTCRGDEQYGQGNLQLAEEQEELNHTGRQSQHNIQSLWHKFKDDCEAAEFLDKKSQNTVIQVGTNYGNYGITAADCGSAVPLLQSTVQPRLDRAASLRPRGALHYSGLGAESRCEPLQ